MTQVELDKEYMGLYMPRQMMDEHLYGQISYNGSFSNTFKLSLGYILKLLSVEMTAAPGKDIVAYIIRPAMIISTSHAIVS